MMKHQMLILKRNIYAILVSPSQDSRDTVKRKQEGFKNLTVNYYKEKTASEYSKAATLYTQSRGDSMCKICAYLNETKSQHGVNN